MSVEKGRKHDQDAEVERRLKAWSRRFEQDAARCIAGADVKDILNTLSRDLEAEMEEVREMVAAWRDFDDDARADPDLA